MYTLQGYIVVDARRFPRHCLQTLGAPKGHRSRKHRVVEGAQQAERQSSSLQRDSIVDVHLLCHSITWVRVHFCVSLYECPRTMIFELFYFFCALMLRHLSTELQLYDAQFCRFDFACLNHSCHKRRNHIEVNLPTRSLNCFETAPNMDFLLVLRGNDGDCALHSQGFITRRTTLFGLWICQHFTWVQPWTAKFVAKVEAQN